MNKPPEKLTRENLGRVLQQRAGQLKRIAGKMTEDGNWDHDPYSLGMTNGLLIALCLLDGKDPVYLKPPEKWGAAWANSVVGPTGLKRRKNPEPEEPKH